MSGINIHIYPSPITHESRMLKETAALAAASLFTEIHLVGVSAQSLPAEEQIDNRRRIVRLGGVSKSKARLARLVRVLGFMVGVVRRYRRCSLSVVSCHCLALLPVSIVLKILTGAKLVYETHELETERNGWGQLVRLISKVIESVSIRFVDWTVVVGPSIERWYQDRYALSNTCVVRNIPTSRHIAGKTGLLRSTFNIPDQSLVYLYQGLLNKGRGIELAIRVFSRLSEHHLVILGFGPLEEEVKLACREHANIHFLGALPPGQSEPYTAGADVGLAIFENTSLSYYYSCPNKLFEYILAGTPVVVSDFPDMAAVVDGLKCGWKVAPDEASLGQLVAALGHGEVQKCAKSALEHGPTLSWEHEARILVDAYRRVLSRESGAPVERYEAA